MIVTLISTAEAARVKEPEPTIGGDERVHGHDDAAASGDASDHRRPEDKSADDFEVPPDDTAMDCCAGLQTLPPSPVPVPKLREWKWRSPAKRQATLAASSSSSARPTDSLQAEPIEEVHTDTAIVAIELETVSVPAEAVENPMVPASELANPVPLQPAVPDLEPPAEVAAAAAGVDLVVPKAKVSSPVIIYLFLAGVLALPITLSLSVYTSSTAQGGGGSFRIGNL